MASARPRTPGSPRRRPRAESLETRALMAIGFDATALPATGRPAAAVASADFNGDGVPDLVEAGTTGPGAVLAAVAVRIGRGDGSFADPVIYDQTGTRPTAVVAGDFGGNGSTDFVVVQGQYRASYTVKERRLIQIGPGFVHTYVDVTYPETPSTFQFFANRGDGSFEPGPRNKVMPEPATGVAADFNGDGRLDLALDRGVYLGNGDGTFADPLTFAEADGPRFRSLAAADLNNDGVPDLVAGIPYRSGSSGSSTPARIEARLGRGDGTFADPVIVAGLRNMNSPSDLLATGDFNGDGRVDLAVRDSGVRILLGRGDGTFDPGAELDFGAVLGSLVAADFDRDGRLDLAATARDDGQVLVAPGNGDGTFRVNAFAPATPAPDPAPLTRPDLNGDGVPDRLALARGSRSIDNRQPPPVYTLSGQGITVQLGRADGTFDPLPRIAEPNRIPLAADAADLDGDGIPDLIDFFEVFEATPRQGIGVRLGRGDGTFEPPVDIDLGTDVHTGFSLGDIDGNGRLDLVVVDTTLGGVRVVMNRSTPGSALFDPVRDEAAGPNPGPVALLDLDGDGLQDLAVVVLGGVVYLPGRGGGAFGPATVIDEVAGATPVALAVGDVDGDGRADLAVGYRRSGGTDNAGLVRVVPGRPAGSGPPSATLQLRTSGFLTGVAVEDRDGDGVADILVRTNRGDIVALGQGGGAFLQPLGFAVAASPGPLLAADLDGDSRPDLVAFSTVAGGGTVLRNTTPPAALPFAVAGLSLAEAGPAAPASRVVARIDDADRLALASDYRALVNWGDGSPIEEAAVVARGPGRFEVVGLHAYARAGSYTIYVAIRNVARGTEDGTSSSLVIAAAPEDPIPPVIVDPPVNPNPPEDPIPPIVGPPRFPTPPAPVLTAGLDPASDTGPSASDRLTRDNRPNFVGVADPGAIIDVYIRAVDAAGRLGDYVSAARGVAGPDGAWSLRSIPLADGAYAVTVLASPPANGQTVVEVATAAQPLRIATAGPAVARVVVGPRRGRIFVTFADPGAGIDLAGGAGQAASYRVGGARQARRNPVTGVTVIDDRTVMLTIRGGRPISPQARRALQVRAGRIADRAGNPLGTTPPARFAPVRVAAAHPGRKVRTT